MSESLLTMALELLAMSEEEIESAAIFELLVAMPDEFVRMLELLLLIAIACEPIAIVFSAISEELVAIDESCVRSYAVACACNCPADSSRIAARLVCTVSL